MMANSKSVHKESKKHERMNVSIFTEDRAFLVLLSIGLILRVWQLNWQLPHLYEEAIPLRFGMRFWDLAKSPIDRSFFVYPCLTYYLQFLVQASFFGFGFLTSNYQNVAGFLAAYENDPTSIVVAARMVSVIFDAGTLVVAYLFLTKIADRRSALFATALLALNPLHISQAHLINVDTPLAFFSLLALYCLYQLFLSPSKRWYLLSGVVIGLAAATKYNAGILVIALVVVQMLRATSLSEAIRSLRGKYFLVGIALTGAVFLTLNPLILTHFSDFLFKFQATEAHMEAGHLGLDSSSSTLGFYLTQSLPTNLGWILTAIVVVATGSFIVSRDKRKYIILIIPALYLLLLGSWQMRADRYIFPIIPFLIIIASIGMFQLWDLVVTRIPSGPLSSYLKKESGVGLVGIILFVIVGFSSMGSVVRYHRTLALPDTRSVAKDWIDQNLPARSAVAAGPFGIELSDTKFLKLPIQFSAVNSEQMAPFYDTRWYEDLDLLVASDFDYGRYLQDPQRYRDMLGFYDSLKGHWHLSSEFTADESHSGPTIWLYTFAAPRSDTRFDPSLLAKLDSPALENERKVSFLGKLGLILMVKGRTEKSEQVFRKLLEIDSENVEAKGALAQVVALRNQHSNQVHQIAGPKDSESEALRRLEESAHNLFQNGKLAEAEAVYKELLRRDKNSHAAYQGLMLVYGTQDDRGKVIDILTKYLTILPPGSDEHRLVQDQIDQLKE